MILMYISICISVHKEHDVAKNDMSNTRLFHLSMVATWAWCHSRATQRPTHLQPQQQLPQVQQLPVRVGATKTHPYYRRQNRMMIGLRR